MRDTSNYAELMHKAVVLIFAAISCVVWFAPAYTTSTQIKPEPVWSTVAAPSQPMALVSTSSNITWRYPFDKPAPAGKYRVSNAIVDKSQRTGAWSKETELVLASGWQLFGGSWNQPASSDDVGIVWRVKCVAVQEEADFTNGSEHYFQTTYESNSVAPYSINTPEPSQLYIQWQRFMTIGKLTLGGRHTLVAPAPVVVASQIPRVPCEVAYCRVTETGEGKLSPPLVITPAAMPGNPQAMLVHCRITEPHPQGALGYHVYRREIGGQWRRCVAPHCYGEPAHVNDWLYQWWDMQPRLFRCPASAPIHAPVRNPQSRMNTLQIALRDTTGDITLPAGTSLTCSCPVIDEWRVEPPFFTFRRTIQAAGGQWKLTAVPSQSGHTYWPAIGVYNQYDTWKGVIVEAPLSSAAIAYADWSGGQGFGNDWTGCIFNGGDVGLLVHERSTGNSIGGHTASEQAFTRCTFTGRVPIWIAGVQSANYDWHGDTYAISTSSDRRASAVYTECPNELVWWNKLSAHCPTGGAIFRANYYPVQLKARVWVDQGFNTLLEAGQCSPRLKIGGKLNCWAESEAENLTLARTINPPAGSLTIVADELAMQFMFAPEIELVSPRYHDIELRVTDSVLSEVAVIREPTRKQEQARADVIYPWGYHAVPERLMPGFQVTLPSVTQSTSAVSVTVPEQVLSFNSLTGRQRTRRINWTE